MKALVLGGTRFIGRRLVEELLAGGHRVTIYTRGRATDGFGSKVEHLIGDRRSAGELRQALSSREFDVAYDLVSYDADDARGAVAALGGRVGHFVHVSTCSVYWCTGDFPCPVAEEEFGRHGDFAERPTSIEYEYGYKKRKAEETLFAAYTESGFPVTTLRMPVVGGEGDLSLRYESYRLRAADGRPLGMPDGGHAPFRHVYVGDVASTMAAIPGRPAAIGQAYNLAGAEILSVRAVVTAIAAILGASPRTVDIPTHALHAMGLSTAFSPFTQQAAQVPAIFKARHDLGWSPTPYPIWLERAVRWGVDTASSRAEVPHAYTLRQREVVAIESYEAACLTLADAGGTSSARPG